MPLEKISKWYDSPFKNDPEPIKDFEYHPKHPEWRMMEIRSQFQSSPKSFKRVR